MEKLSDCWETPDCLFKELSEKYGDFDTDLCANKDNAKCQNYFTDYFNSQPEPNKIHWMNLPYSNPLPFIQKAWEDSKHCKIVCLVKVDPSTKWWAVFWEYDGRIPCYNCQGQFNPNSCLCKGYRMLKYNGPKPGCEVHFLPKRVKFNPPKGWEGKQSGPSFASAVIIMDRRGL